MPTHKTRVIRPDNDDAPRVPLLRPAAPAFKLPPKLDRVIPENDQPYVRSSTAVDGAGHGPDQFATTPAVRVVELPQRRPPSLKLQFTIDLSVAPNAGAGGYQKFSVQGNTLLYADSTNGTDRLKVKYAITDGDQTAPDRSMVPGRLRREAPFAYLYFTWTVTAGATATVEVYDDPDGLIDIL